MAKRKSTKGQTTI